MPEPTFVDIGPDDEKDLRRWYDLAAVAHAVDRPGDPIPDLSWEQEVFDTGRLAEHDRVWLDRGTGLYTTAVVHDETGVVAGSTTAVVFVGAVTGAYQWQTIVLPEHRGHRLGMLLKLANLDHLRAHEPRVRTVDTWNADSNAHMLRVNVAMGFEPVRQWSGYERAV